MRYTNISPNRVFYSKKFREALLQARSQTVIRNLDRTLETDREKLDRMWNAKNIPRDVFQIYEKLFEVLPKSKVKDLVNRELSALEQNKSKTQMILQSISAREKVLKTLFKFNKELKNRRELGEQDYLNCLDLLKTYVKLTITTIKNIHEWKESLRNSVKLAGYNADFNIDFIWNRVSYMKKMRNDFQIADLSHINKIFRLSNQPDPLLAISLKKHFSDSLLTQIKHAEKILFNGFINSKSHEHFRRLPKVNILNPFKMATGQLLEEFIANECKSLAFESLKDMQNEYIARVIFNQYLEGELDFVDTLRTKEPDLRGIVYEDLLDSLVFQSCREYSEEVICEEILYRLESEIIDEICLETYRNSKQLDTMSALQSEILDNILTEIAEIDGIKEISAHLTLDSLEQLLINEECYAIADDVTFQALEALSTEKEYTRNSDIIINDSSITLVPLKAKESEIQGILEDYYSMIPQPILSVCEPVDLLMSEAFGGVDPSWYWLVSDVHILGLLVFSTKSNPNIGKHVNVHHISSLNVENYKAILAETVSFLQKHTNYIRVDIFEELPSQLKKIFTALKFKWKASTGRLVHMGIENPNKVNTISNSIRAVCSLLLDNSPGVNPENTFEMMKYGNRICLLSALKALGSLEFRNNMQEELRSRIHDERVAFTYTENILSSNKNELQRFLEQRENRDLLIGEGKHQSVSSMNINFNWSACTNLVHNGIMFMKLKKPIGKIYENFEIFEFAIDLPGFKAIFVRSKNLVGNLQVQFRIAETDLFLKTQKLLQEAELSNRDYQEIWAPAFEINSLIENSWVRGIQSEDQFVVRCLDHFNVSVKSNRISEGILMPDDPKNNIIDTEFIFAIVEENKTTETSIPVFAVLVEEKDWIKY